MLCEGKFEDIISIVLGGIGSLAFVYALPDFVLVHVHATSPLKPFLGFYLKPPTYL